MGSIIGKIHDPDTLKNCFQTNQLLRDLTKEKLQEFHRSVEDKLITIRTTLENKNDKIERNTAIEQELKKLISPDLSPESFIELGLQKLMNEFHETCVDIGDACKCN